MCLDELRTLDDTKNEINFNDMPLTMKMNGENMNRKIP